MANLKFEQIVDFLNAHPIKYALMINPTIYISYIEQFWSTIKAKTINGEQQLHALVDGKKVIITESTVRRDLQLEDEEGVDCLPNATIFEQLALMGRKENHGGLYYSNSFENVSKLSNDSLLARGNTLQSDEDRLKLNELMELCTNLQKKVLDLEKTKTTQANEIASLKRRVKKLEQKKSITGYDDADKEMFDVDTLNNEEVFVTGQNENVVEEIVDAAQVSTAATTTTISSQGLSQDKGKGILVEPEKPLKKKDQLKLYEEIALKLQAEIDEEERIARAKEKKIDGANIAWDDIQAKVDADYQLAERLQVEEQDQFTIKQKATLFKELLEQRRKHFASKRVEEKRNNPLTKTQQKKIMITYLMNMEGWKHKDLKSKDFDYIK
ncbi:hypothetical protein Tco_1230533 [Tanacetum coccineum]